jgi:hypothetical protein
MGIAKLDWQSAAPSEKHICCLMHPFFTVVKTIAVTGDDFPLPAELAVVGGDPYEALAGAIGGRAERGLVELFYNDIEYAEKILYRGPQKDAPGYALAASVYANRIGEPLELILNGTRPTGMGTLLQGSLIVRGSCSVDTGSMNRGTLYVDGDVEHIKNPSGLVYVKGNVGMLEQIYRGVVIIVGDVGESVQSGNINSDTLLRPSPFVFTTKTITLYGYAGEVTDHPTTKTYVVPSYQLSGWTPTTLHKRAAGLCKRRLADDLNKKRRSLGNVHSVEDAVKFHSIHIEGYHSGYAAGFREGTMHREQKDD